MRHGCSRRGVWRRRRLKNARNVFFLNKHMPWTLDSYKCSSPCLLGQKVFCQFNWIKLNLPGKWERLNLSFFGNLPAPPRATFCGSSKLLAVELGQLWSVVELIWSRIKKRYGNKWRRNGILLVEKELFSFPCGDNKPCGSLKRQLCWPFTSCANGPLKWADALDEVGYTTYSEIQTIIFLSDILLSGKLLTCLSVRRRRLDCQSDTVCCGLAPG